MLVYNIPPRHHSPATICPKKLPMKKKTSEISAIFIKRMPPPRKNVLLGRLLLLHPVQPLPDLARQKGMPTNTSIRTQILKSFDFVDSILRPWVIRAPEFEIHVSTNTYSHNPRKAPHRRSLFVQPCSRLQQPSSRLQPAPELSKPQGRETG